MVFPFFHKKDTDENKNENLDQFVSEESLLPLSEKELLLRQLDPNQFDNFCLRYSFSPEQLTTLFAKKLIQEHELLNYLMEHFVNPSIVEKINQNSLRFSDITWDLRGLLQFDLFPEVDQEIIHLIQKKIEFQKEYYMIFHIDEFGDEKSIFPKVVVKDTIPSFFDHQEILLEERECFSLESFPRIRYDQINIIIPINSEEVIHKYIFNSYYEGELNFDKKTIICIPFSKFQELIREPKHLELLQKSSIIFQDDWKEVTDLEQKISLFDPVKNQFEAYELKPRKINTFLTQVQHLLYIVQNSKLPKNKKDYYNYKIQNIYLSTDQVWDLYSAMEELKEIAQTIQEAISEENLSLLTKNFNQLPLQMKTKDITPQKFSVSIFLSQFEDLSEISSFQFLQIFQELSDDERKEVLTSSVVIEKLQGLLAECYNEYHKYQRMVSSLKMEELFIVFDSQFIKDFYEVNYPQYEYRFFHTILEHDINQAINFILQDERYLKELLKDGDRYDFYKIDYEKLLQLLKKVESLGIDTNLSFLGTVKKSDQYKLLREDFSDSLIVPLIKNCSREVQQLFYLGDSRFQYLYKQFHLLQLCKHKYKMPDHIIHNEYFFKSLSSNSLIQFRANINQFSSYQPTLFLEEQFKKYEDKCISKFHLESGMFLDYEKLIQNIHLLDDTIFIYQGLNYFLDSNINYELRNYISYDKEDHIHIKDQAGLVEYLQEESKLKLNELVIDRLFQDHIYNVFLNIREMLRFHQGLNKKDKVLSDDQVLFYETILDIDILDSKEVLEFYEKFKDKNVALMFYEDLRKIKDLSYEKIKQDLIQPEKLVGQEDPELTQKYGVPVYDFRDKDFVILARCLTQEYEPVSHHRRDCYTVLSNENPDVYLENALKYGYSGFDNDCILHVFEADSYSGDVKDDWQTAGSDRVNRIMTGQELATSSTWYSEVQIVNREKQDSDNIFEPLKPSFLIAYDQINKDIQEEAQRLHIPIVIIKFKLLKKRFSEITYQEEIDDYINSDGISYGEERKRRNYR